MGDTDLTSGEWFTIGKVTGVHGLKGFLKVWSFADSIDTFGVNKLVLLKSGNGQKEYTILQAQPHKKGALLLLKGITDRNLAEPLIESEILMDRSQLPEPEEDSWYWQDLIGLDVEDQLNGLIGTINDIFPTEANDILVVKDKDREVLIPMHRNFVESVDLANNLMITSLPEGYLEDTQ